MTTPNTRNAPAELQLDEGKETHLDARLPSNVSPSSAAIADLLRNIPSRDTPDEDRAAWINRKRALLDAIEETTR